VKNKKSEKGRDCIDESETKFNELKHFMLNRLQKKSACQQSCWMGSQLASWKNPIKIDFILSDFLVPPTQFTPFQHNISLLAGLSPHQMPFFQAGYVGCSRHAFSHTCMIQPLVKQPPSTST